MARYEDDEPEYRDTGGAVRCVDCGARLGDGVVRPDLPPARYGPPAPDWLVRCAACYPLITGGAPCVFVAPARLNTQDRQRRQLDAHVARMAPWNAARGVDVRVASVVRPEHLWSIDDLAADLMRRYPWYGEDGRP